MFEAHTFCIYNYLELLTALFGLDLATLDIKLKDIQNTTLYLEDNMPHEYITF
jgi:hypothetical protein